MTKLIINGSNGRMGRELLKVAASADEFEVTAGVDPAADTEAVDGVPFYTQLSDVTEHSDVIVDFSRPEGIFDLLKHAVELRMPVLIATTGLDASALAAVEDASQSIPILRAANMSLGVNVLKMLAQQSAAVLGRAYDIEIVERHHRMKRDAPSGTALLLADAVREVVDTPREYLFGRHERDRLRTDTEIGIHAVRGGTIVGEHDVIFAGPDEMVTVGHKAYSRVLFANGALKAAEYLSGKPVGLYSMDDLVSESIAVTRLYSSAEALVSFSDLPAEPAAAFDVFRAFGTAGISIDMISQTATGKDRHSLSFSVADGDSLRASSVINELATTSESAAGVVTDGLTKITVEGIGMELQTGVACTVFGILNQLNVESKAVTTSETKIACLVATGNHDEVVREIRVAFNI